MDWTATIVMLCLFLLMALGLYLLRLHDNVKRLRTMMESIFLGRAADSEGISFRGIAPESLCRPLTADTLQQMHDCPTVHDAYAQISLKHPTQLLRGRAYFAVSYRFDGTDRMGERVLVEENARVCVCFEDPNRRHGYSTLVVTWVSLLQPRDAEKGR